MLRTFVKRSFPVGRTLFGGMLLIAAVSLPGCRWWQAKTLRGEGFAEEDQKLTEGYRSPDEGNSPWSFSTKGQQIERNLGVSK
ncbi:MAG: hypothetical protein WD176_08540 [Pirellulales bacterium]